MHLKFRNVTEALPRMAWMMAHPGGRPHPLDPLGGGVSTNIEPSRYGEVMRCVEPMIITYARPWERVLINSGRDANPFFHLYEALWMLDGRRDVASLAHYVKRMRTFSDDGETVHDAYGWRWRNLGNPSSYIHGVEDMNHWDQLEALCGLIKSGAAGRRAVLQMWDSSLDLMRLESNPSCKAVPCNLCCVFEVEDDQFLNMSVFNRSNDIVWGALGANACHFSLLHEYVALSCGLMQGTYNQISVNLHAYVDNWHWEAYCDSRLADPWLHYGEKMSRGLHVELWGNDADDSREQFLRELPLLLNRYDGHAYQELLTAQECDIPAESCEDYSHGGWSSIFLNHVATPLLQAHELHKLGDAEAAVAAVDSCAAMDWREAAHVWLHRRMAERRRREAAVRADSYNQE